MIIGPYFTTVDVLSSLFCLKFQSSLLPFLIQFESRLHFGQVLLAGNVMFPDPSKGKRLRDLNRKDCVTFPL